MSDPAQAALSNYNKITRDMLQEALENKSVRNWSEHLTDSRGSTHELQSAVDFVAAHILAWLRSWKGRQFAAVSRTGKFWYGRNYGKAPGGIIELIITHSNREEQFFVRLEPVGYKVFRILIYRSSDENFKKPVWKRVAHIITNAEGYTMFQTLPRSDRDSPGGY